MEHRYCILQKHLNELGYSHEFTIDSVPLVERLLSDLITTTESLQHYKDVAQEALQERDSLQLGAEPYKCDNARLVKECNDLHLTFLRFREQTEKLQTDLNQRIASLKKEKEELLKRVEQNQRAQKPLTTSRSSVSVNSKSKTSSKTENVKAKENTMMDQKVVHANKEIKRLKDERSQQFELIDCLNNKLSMRNKEIERLNKLLEGGRPIQALNKDCCYKDINVRLAKLNDVNAILVKEKKDFEVQLADAIAKQHEAMKRALNLADRNKELEKELSDLDRMALAVEADCNSTIKKNVDKVSQYQGELNSLNYKIVDLERQVTELRRHKNTLEANFEAVKHEKDNLHGVLENALIDKKRLTDRINQFTRIEHDLNLEIDKLVKTTTLQQRQISELQCQITSEKFQIPENENGFSRNKCHSDLRNDVCKCCQKCLVSKKERQHSQRSSERTAHASGRYKSAGEKSAKCTERQAECEQCKSLRSQLQKYDQHQDNIMEIKRKLNEKEQALTNLQHENKDIVREKHELMTQLESAKEMNQLNQELGGVSVKSAISRLEKERDMARGDVRRLEDERDALRQRIKMTTDTGFAEREKLQRLLKETEEKLQLVETDRREIMTVQGSRRATINGLEEQVETLADQLRTTKSELTHVHTLYNQLKTLQEQTDRALADSQSQLTQVETEFSRSQDRVRDLEKNRSELEEEVATLRNDIVILKGNLNKLDSEKDALLMEVDGKTETIAALEDDLKLKDNKLLKLESNVAELKHKLSLTADDSTSKEYLLKNSSSEISALRRELENATEMKSNALSENRRLQEELSAVVLDYRSMSNELDISKRDVEDLKRQLQQYVYEVKRAEDLITKKECERSEMLDQFRSLSHEATILENNNHSLESQALETKTRLSQALDQISDLQHKIQQNDTMNRGYETQISQLTSQVANMEIQMKQHDALTNKTEAELVSVRELCLKLDEQKDKLMKDVAERDAQQSQVEMEKERLQRETEKLRQHASQERRNSESLENLLAASRQDLVQQRLLNEELQSETARLKKLVEELQSKLSLVQNPRGRSRSVVTTINTDVRFESPKTDGKEDVANNNGFSNEGTQTSVIDISDRSDIVLTSSPSKSSLSDHLTVSLNIRSPSVSKSERNPERRKTQPSLKFVDRSKPPYCYYTDDPFRRKINVRTSVQSDKANCKCKDARGN